MERISKHPAAQSAKNALANGPVGDAVKSQSRKTSAEFRDLAHARTTPEHPAATGQPLTHYHSMFYRVLSWKNPRASAISFLATVLIIFATRYLPVLRYFFKLTYLTLGTTAVAEILGKTVLGNGLASQFRPRQYYTIPRDSLNRFLDDVDQLLNFFVIEAQRIVYAENIYVTVTTFLSAFLSYYLIRVLPFWGLALMGTSVLYLGPLIYIKNQEFIDAQLNTASKIINAQTAQLRDLAGQHTGRATESIRGYAGDYSQKAQELINQMRAKATGQGVTEADFPKTPKGSVSSPTKATSPTSPTKATSPRGKAVPAQ
jgi:ABC-type multidrug transport system fused ATPase/permease subunit